MLPGWAGLIALGPDSFDPADATDLNGTALFTVCTAETGRGLWMTDGITDGTATIATLRSA